MTKEYVKIAPLESLVEAQVIEFILTDQHIPHRYVHFTTRLMTGCFNFKKEI